MKLLPRQTHRDEISQMRGYLGAEDSDGDIEATVELEDTAAAWRRLARILTEGEIELSLIFPPEWGAEELLVSPQTLFAEVLDRVPFITVCAIGKMDWQTSKKREFWFFVAEDASEDEAYAALAELEEIFDEADVDDGWSP